MVEILKSHHSNENYWAVVFRDVVNVIVLFRGSGVCVYGVKSLLRAFP